MAAAGQAAAPLLQRPTHDRLEARQLAKEVPHNWTSITVDLWRDFGEFTLTGLAPTALGGPAFFDRIELLRTSEVEAAANSIPP